MPPPSNVQTNKGCWKDRPKLKIALAIITPSTLLLVIILLAVFIKSGGGKIEPNIKLDKSIPGFCTSDSCIQQTNKLKKGMNLDINPCDDFYHFVCGNVLKDTNRKNFYDDVFDREHQDLLKLYNEDVKDSEHKMVKIAKGLFRKCLNTEDIERDNLTSIKEVIKEVGGWPILDEENKKFDWVGATYKLRDLGYPFSIFINMDVTRDAENIEQFYLTVRLADKEDKYGILEKYSQSEVIEMMVQVAKQFGVKTDEILVAERELRDVYDLWKRFPPSSYGDYEKYTVEELQILYDKLYEIPFNWSEFLNKMVGPQIVIFPKDYISIRNPRTFHDWFKLLSTTSERTLGNFMIWRVIETQLPYLPSSIQTIMKYSNNNTREEFCFKETNKRFIVSPIEVINTKDLIPAEEQQDVQEVFSNIKSEFLNLVQKANWMDEKDKRVITEKAKKFTLIYGLPGNYLNDSILDDMDVDLVERKTDSFLSYLAQANRNLQTIIFKQITLPVSANPMSRTYFKRKSYFRLYHDTTQNEFFLPTALSYSLPSDTPRYFKYLFIGGSFGAFFMTSVSKPDFEFAWRDVQMSEKTTSATEELLRCIENQMEKYNLTKDNVDIKGSSAMGIGKKISYTAYEKWIQRNGEERLPDLDYTPRQLFWIAGTYCHVPTANIYYPLFNDVDSYSTVNFVSLLNNPDFANDFNCTLGSKSNPSVKCPLLL